MSWSWCLFAVIETLTETEVSARIWSIAVTGLIMLLFEGMWTLGLWTRKIYEPCKWGLMSHLSWSIGDSSIESNVICGDPAQKVSEGKCVRGHSCNIFQRMWLLFALV